MRAYESILEVINDKTVKKNQGNKTTIDYYEGSKDCLRQWTVYEKIY